MERLVTIIVPVYNAFDETKICLLSVLRHSPADCKILVIDDASPQGLLAEYLPAVIAQDKRVTLIRNEGNLGFVKTCNRGMLELSDEDVILLNSDTEVTTGWVQKLSQAAYARPEIATATPLTNNGVICSVPRFACDNELVPGYTLGEFAALIEACSAREYPELPTCIGFCTYIKRVAIEKLQGFDAEAFGKGYGEENDFSCRAHKLGMTDVLDDATFIYHKGNMSFGDQRTELSKTNTVTLRSRHPTYFDDVGRFCRANPLRNIHNRILNCLLQTLTASKVCTVLHVLHNGPFAERHHPVGGTERHVQDIIRGVPNALHWSLTPSPTAYYLTAHLGFGDREFILDRKTTTLYDIFNSDFFDLVHLQHIQGFNFGEMDAALRQHGNFIVSLHDFNLVCPRVYLLTPDRRHCNGFECTASCSFGEEYITEYRRIAHTLLGAAQSVICFSETTKAYFEKILKAAPVKWKVQPHGIEGLVPGPSRALGTIPVPSAEIPLKVAFLGFVPQHKGSLIVEELLQIKTLKGGIPIEWHIVGELYGKVQTSTHQHGKYERATLPAMLGKINPHVVAILSICPETYSLTLDEAWNAGVPVLSTPLGAPAERVAGTGAGWVLSQLNKEAVLTKLEDIISDWPAYLLRREKVKSLKLIDTSTEGLSYQSFYREAVTRRAARLDLLLKKFDPVSLARAPRPSIVVRVVRRLLNEGIRLLERLRLRVFVERVIYGLLPNRVVQDLKSLR